MRILSKLLLSLLFAITTIMQSAAGQQQDVQSTKVVDRIMSAMSDEEKAAQLILVYFSSSEFITRHEFGAVLVMQNMIKDLEQLSSRLHTLQQKSKIGVLVTIDQEGGKVNRLKYLPEWKHLPSAQTMSKWSSIKIKQHNLRIARVLATAGVHLNLAPVLDPSHNYQGEKTLMGLEQRAFGQNSNQIVARASNMINAFSSQGVLTIAKHFPGYDVAEHSDHEIAISHAAQKYITDNVQAFNMAAPLVDGVMMSSIYYTSMVNNPAVLSPRMVGWARQIFPGKLILTDDLWGVALRTWINPENVDKYNYPDKDFLRLVKMTLEAGSDLLMITYPEKAVLMKHAIVKWMRNDLKLRERVNQSVRRILIAKAKVKLIK